MRVSFFIFLFYFHDNRQTFSDPGSKGNQYYGSPSNRLTPKNGVHATCFIYAFNKAKVSRLSSIRLMTARCASLNLENLVIRSAFIERVDSFLSQGMVTGQTFQTHGSIDTVNIQNNTMCHTSPIAICSHRAMELIDRIKGLNSTPLFW